MEGYIYILSNESMPGIYKIGYTNRDVDERIKELSQATGVPTAFKEEYRAFVPDGLRYERLLHSKLAQYRVNPNKEFFKTDLDNIAAALECLYAPYSNFLEKYKEDYTTIAEIYYEENLKSFLDNNHKMLKENNFDFEYFSDIYKKNDKYYIALVKAELCNEEDYQDWVNSKKTDIIASEISE